MRSNAAGRAVKSTGDFAPGRFSYLGAGGGYRSMVGCRRRVLPVCNTSAACGSGSEGNPSTRFHTGGIP